MHVRTGNYGPDFVYRAEKKGTFSCKFNSGSKADRCWRGAETSLIHRRTRKKVHSDFATVEQEFKSRFQRGRGGGGGGSKVFTVKTRTEKLSTNITRDPKKLVWEVGCTDKCFNFSPSF